MTEPMPEPTDVHPPLGDDVLWVPRIACQILGTTTDQLIDLVRAGQLVARQVDGMLMLREGDLYALANTRQERAEVEPTDLPPTRRAAVLDVAAMVESIGNPTVALMVRRLAERYPDGEASVMVCNGNGRAVVTWPNGRGAAVCSPEMIEGLADRVNQLAAEVEQANALLASTKALYQRRMGSLTTARDEADRLAEELRQQQLRQQLAEREVADLRAEVLDLTNRARLLGPARMVLDRCAESRPGSDAEAADMAQRIVDWIGHPVTDEPATAADLQAEVYRLQHLLYGDAGPDTSDPDGGATCADVAVDGDPIRVHGQHPLSPAASEAVAAVIRATRAALAEHGPSDG